MLNVDVTSLAGGSSKEEMLRMCTNSMQRENLDNKAELYSIFVAMEHLERTFVKDNIQSEEYTMLCNRLITQYKTCKTALGSEFDIVAFIKVYGVQCPLAFHRLVETGIPATEEHGTGSAPKAKAGNTAKHVAETVQIFMTLLDALQMNIRSVKEIHPQLIQLARSLNNVPSLPARFEGRDIVLKWSKKLNQMLAGDQLSSEDTEQLIHELGNAYDDFCRCLE